ncbi:MAG: hypothetical protein ACFE9S_19495 [Candidatus Hermodarchaeota archaeon]
MSNIKFLFVIILLYTPTISPLGSISSTSWIDNVIPICTEWGDQWGLEICSDGVGGAIITWRDGRNGAWDIYAQRVDSSGSIQWTTNGIAICNETDHQIDPKICSDGHGGAFIVWGDRRNGNNYQIYAQRVNADGIIQWSENGIVICDRRCVVNHQILYGNDENLIVTWIDYRPDDGIFAQKVDLNGNIQWKTNGIPICNATSTQWDPRICTDGEDGAIIIWDDERRFDYLNEDIYAQRISSNGIVQWEINGVNISNSIGSTSPAQLVSDKNGGAIITWLDDRSGDYNVYSQRVNSTGSIQWVPDGITICNANNSQGSTCIVEDGLGGVVITWEDCRTGSNWDIYAQRIGLDGSIKWEEDGVLLYNANNDGDLYSTLYHQSYYNGKNGVFLVYLDYRNTDSSRDIYAQHLNLNGKIQWEHNGKAICNDLSDQGSPKAAITGFGKAIIVWGDNRNFDTDIYASLINLYPNQIINAYHVFLLLMISFPVILILVIKIKKKRESN